MTDQVNLVEGDPIRFEQNDFAEAIRLKRYPKVDLAEGTADVAVVEAIIRSCEDRRFVDIKEVYSS